MFRDFLRSTAFALFFLLSAVANGQTKKVTYYYTDPQGTPLAETDDQGIITAPWFIGRRARILWAKLHRSR
jgi:hypothetical protein